MELTLNNKQTLWKIVAVIEIAVALLVITLDLFIPSLVIVGIAAISLLARREGLSSLGFKKVERFGLMAVVVLLLVVAWDLLVIGFFTPLLNRLTGTTQDVSGFLALKGNLGMLLVYLGATWTLAAFGEEIAFRGYLQRRLSDVFGEGGLGIFLTIVISSLLFCLIHTEQGIVGMVTAFLDAIFFSLLKRRYANSLWPAILAHGFSNTIGMIAFYFVGPIYGLW